MASCLWIYCGDCAAVLHQRPNTFWPMAMGISDLSDNAHSWSVPPPPLTLTPPPHTQMHYSPGEPRMLPPSSPSHCHQRGGQWWSAGWCCLSLITHCRRMGGRICSPLYAPHLCLFYCAFHIITPGSNMSVVRCCPHWSTRCKVYLWIRSSEVLVHDGTVTTRDCSSRDISEFSD
jgi:hypothetical protein